jgi:uncharacterized DUF497 family protein
MSDGGTDRTGARIHSDSITYCYYLSSINCKSFVWSRLADGTVGSKQCVEEEHRISPRGCGGRGWLCCGSIGTSGRTRSIRSAQSRRAKRGVWFEKAQSVFSDPQSQMFLDPGHSEEEERFLLLELSSAARVLVVVHCYRESDSVVRIISARKAIKKESRFYEEGI